MRTAAIAISLLWLALGFACRDSERASPQQTTEAGDETMTIDVTSSAFAEGERIPTQYTGDGADISPPLAWSGIPADAVELALICDDPDAPRADPWVHWVIYGLGGDVAGLAENVPTDERLNEPTGAVQGKNDWGRIGYGGPAPPRGHGTHHYHFTVFALDTALGAAPGLTKMQLVDAMSGHILARGELIGTYSR